MDTIESRLDNLLKTLSHLLLDATQEQKSAAAAILYRSQLESPSICECPTSKEAGLLRAIIAHHNAASIWLGERLNAIVDGLATVLFERGAYGLRYSGHSSGRQLTRSEYDERWVDVVMLVVKAVTALHDAGVLDRSPDALDRAFSVVGGTARYQ